MDLDLFSGTTYWGPSKGRWRAWWVRARLIGRGGVALKHPIVEEWKFLYV